MTALPDIPDDLPVLIAGPTASGKSALALDLAARRAGPIVNADALQVFDGWRVLTARPDALDEARHPHRLYGHVAPDHAYSVGAWLRDVIPFLTGPPPIIVGGTGLYFRALTEGLVEIPDTPKDVRAEGDMRMARLGVVGLAGELDAETAHGIDLNNPARVQRAWEVLTATGRGLAAWQAETPPPLVPLSACVPLVMNADKHWLNARIERRFDLMLSAGALEEAEALAPEFDPSWPSAKAIGAVELIEHVRGERTLTSAREASVIATRQYAKRQRTWFRARMKDWVQISVPS
ncbi:MAG: tRNA (adenosine(37)-N6)-dimethylallyltransferase MiaA [Pseudomonadota bacterium]